MVNYIKIKSCGHNVELITNGVASPKSIVLCLHGFNGNRWGDGFSTLRKQFTDILVCSFDSAGHGESEISSIDMTLKIAVQEIIDVVDYLHKNFSHVPITIFASSYGAYRTMVALSREKLDVKNLVFINPAFNILKVLEVCKEFDYTLLKTGELVPMKKSLGKLMTKKFLDELFENDIYNMRYLTTPPLTIFIGNNDTLIKREDIFKFAKCYDCELKYLEDGHCLENPDSWQEITKFLEDK